MRRTLHDGGDVSPLAEGRELKFVAIADALLIDLVAPRRGAGIEMISTRFVPC